MPCGANNKIQLQIQRHEAIMHNLKAQVSQLMEAFNVQQANIMDSTQEKCASEAKFEVLMKDVRVEH